MIHLNNIPKKYPGGATEEFRYAWPIAAAMEQSPEFCRWLLETSGYGTGGQNVKLLSEEQLSKRSSSTSYWWRHNFCEQNKTKCRFGACGETDLFAVFKLESGEAVALNIEVKHPRDKLEEDQMRRYPKRAECWRSADTRPSAILPHDQSVTLLVCSKAFEETHIELAQQFDRSILIEELAQKISPYPLPEVVQT